MKWLACLLLLAAGTALCSGLLEKFNDEGWQDRWVHSSQAKYDGRFKAVVPEDWNDTGIQITEKSQHYGLMHMLAEPLDASKGLVLQYEVRFTAGISCGGAYIKLLTDSEGLTADGLSNDTPYSVMFGPDKCGQPTGKLHLIFRHRSPLDGSIEEKHVNGGATAVVDGYTHVYTLVVSPDNTYKILVDGEVKDSGSLFDKFTPPFNPPETIPDPEDLKPEDWVDDAKVPDPSAAQPEDWVDEPLMEDPSAVKPEGWMDGEPELVDDPRAEKPADWDDEEDGEWAPAQVANPKCKVGCGEWKRPVVKNPKYVGEWRAPLIDNPAYKGPWEQKHIPNPAHFVDDAPLANIGRIRAVAFELWTIDAGYTFDNVLVGGSEQEASEARELLWKPRSEGERLAHIRRLKEAEQRVASNSKSLAQVLVAAFDAEPLNKVKPYVQPLLDVITATPLLAYGIFVVPLAMLLLCLCTGSRGSKSAVSRIKKEDLYTPDDDQEQEEQEEEQHQQQNGSADPVADVAASPQVVASSRSPGEARVPSPKDDWPGPVSHQISHQELGEATDDDLELVEQPRRRSSRLKKA